MSDVSNETPQEPVVEETLQEPVVEETLQEPVVEETPQEPVVASDLTQVARECMVKNSRKWLSGRERDELLKKAGFDPAAVRAEIQRLRYEDVHGGGA